MLRIHMAKNAAAIKKYFEMADYYAEGTETIGHWFGDLAKRLGLSGQVTKEAFERLVDNLHPTEDRSLTARTDHDRRIGYDFVFSGPKSFSIIEGLASPDEKRRLNAIFDEAINETLSEDIQPDMRVRVRKDGADQNRVTANMCGAGYDHSTARPIDDDTPPDPHRHRHVFVFNATYDPVERRIKAAQLGDVVRDAPYFQAAFFARLAAKLQAAGYAIERQADGWEIAGVSPSILSKFSKRTAQVEAEHEDRLLNDKDYRPENKHELGAKTRASKQKELTPAQLRKAWLDQLDQGERDALARVYAKAVLAGLEVTAADAVGVAVHGCRGWRDREGSVTTAA